MDNSVLTAKPKTAIQVGELFKDMRFNKRHAFVGFVLFFAFIIEAWEMMIMIFISGAIASEFKLSAVQVGTLIGSIYLGMIPGAYAWGFISDKLGRKKTMIYSLLLYTLFSVISAFSPNFEVLYISRVLAGISLSGMLVCIFPYFEEMLPVKERGKFGGYLSAGWPFGVLLAIGVTAIFIGVEGSLGGWRIIMFISALAGLWGLLLIKIPESPYWLAGKGRQEEAKEVIRYLSKGTINIDQYTKLEVLDVKQANYFEIFKGKLLKLTTLQTIVNFTLSFGYWGLYTWIPALLQQKGLSMSQSLGFIALTSIIQIPGYMAASHLTAKFGRKKILFTFVAGAAISGFLFAFSSNMFELYAFNFLLSFFNQGAWAVWNTWFGEIYPTNIRGAGYSFGAASQRWANTFAPSIIGLVIGLGWAFGSVVSFIEGFVVVTIITMLFIHETEGKILE
ncbi:MFS transporter [Neobacillus cucumis]|uniref:MFS transporter n=1 Tax=Neobacillus cucumis TaxID=1740721 RepID=UPI0018DFAC33|nr:MFS transporter [Neobacillus cucumis]MBI0579489.1 MFS transporter [Neobacillus cucumis]